MFDKLFRPQRLRRLAARIRAHRIGKEIEEFAVFLVNRGHSRNGALHYLQAIEHLSSWMHQERMRLTDLNEQTIRSLWSKHLRRCRCPRPASHSVPSLRAAGHLFLRFLRERRYIPDPAPATLSPVERAVQEFDRHMVETCGLALNTRIYRIRYVRQFLRHRFGRGRVRPEELRPFDVMRFIAHRAASCRPGSAKVIAAAVRSYLKFLVLKGRCENAIVHSIPTVPQWKLAHLPKRMPFEDVNRFLSSIDRASSKGPRDYAMALCLTDLGLRTCEVAEIRLEDLDWRQGTLRVAATKTHRERILPLLPRLARALIEYLRRGRPRTHERLLFLRSGFWAGQPADANTIRRVLERIYRRSGAATPWAGPHVFRHTVATRLLERGARMKDVADVLGHGSIDSTAIYAKVNLPMLSQLAAPWPGGRS